MSVPVGYPGGRAAQHGVCAIGAVNTDGVSTPAGVSPIQALVHVTVGVSGALLALTVVEYPARDGFLSSFLSGLWALLPDGHWLAREAGLGGLASGWKAVHQSAYANVFWFHRATDSLETGRNILDAGGCAWRPARLCPRLLLRHRVDAGLSREPAWVREAQTDGADSVSSDRYLGHP